VRFHVQFDSMNIELGSIIENASLARKSV